MVTQNKMAIEESRSHMTQIFIEFKFPLRIYMAYEEQKMSEYWKKRDCHCEVVKAKNDHWR